jgi:ParB family chromosome partitioning protein
MRKIAGGKPEDGASVTSIARGRDAFSAPAPAPAKAGPSGRPLEIAIDLIDPSADNPRTDLGELEEMAASMRAVGVLEPIGVRPNGERFDLIYGHRRYAAAKLAPLATVPVVFTAAGDEARDLMVRLVENLHREDLPPMDEARGYAKALELGVKGGQRGLAKIVGKSQSHISKRLALLALPEPVQAKIDDGELSTSDATELAKLADDRDRVKEAVKSARSWGGIPQAVARQVREIEEAAAVRAAAEELREAGVLVIETVPTSREHGPYLLEFLPVDPAEHAKLDCHAAMIPQYQTRPKLVCTDPASHLAGEASAEREQAAARIAEREARAEEARQRQAVQTARREFAAGLVRTGSGDAGAAVLMFQLVAPIDGPYFGSLVVQDAVAELLGLEVDEDGGPRAAILGWIAKGTRNAHRAAYAAGLVMGEHAEDAEGTVAYFDHLVSCGYTLAETEQAEVDDARREIAAWEAEEAAERARRAGAEGSES